VISTIRIVKLVGLLVALVALVACKATASRPDVVRLDFAYYNPVGLLLKEKGWLEEDLAKDGIRIEWVHSLGSNKALEYLNSKSIDFGSTAGAAALLARANGNPVKSVLVYSKPEWTALLAAPNSGIREVKDLRGQKVAATRGTDPHVFLLRALGANGMTEKDIELIPLQHPDGKNALERGEVKAWAGLDPLMAQSEGKGNVIFFRNSDWNTYGVLNVREEFAQHFPEYVRRVIKAYERARRFSVEHPDELKAILAHNAKLTDSVAAAVLKRTDISSSKIGDVQRVTIAAAGSALKKSGIIKPDTDVEAVAGALIDSTYTAELESKPESR
jgi:sulfonate transport system substrate-binding protein